MQDVSMRSVVARIKEQGNLLTQVAQVWGVSANTSKDEAVVKLVCEHMQNRFAARSIWQQLNEIERHCLYEVLSASSRAQGVPCERVRKKVKGSEDAFENALTRLRDRWILLEEDEIPAKAISRRGAKLEPALVQPPVLVRAIFPYQELSESLYRTGRELFLAYEARSTQSLQHLLSLMPWEQLEQLTRLCHVPMQKGISVYSSHMTPSISHPSEVQKRVSEALIQPLIVFDLVHRLDRGAQDVFLWLSAQPDGKARMEEVASYLAAQSSASLDLFPILATLEAHALAFDTLLPGGGREVFITGELFAAIKHEALERAADEAIYTLFPVVIEPEEKLESQAVLLYDLATVIGCVYQQTIEPTKEEKIPKRVQTRIRPLLQSLSRSESMQEDRLTDQLFQVAREMELLCVSSEEEDGKARYRPGAKVESLWSRLTLVGQARRFLTHWTQKSSWCDVTIDGKLVYSSSYSTARKSLLALLAECHAERWYRIDALLFTLWKRQPLYLYEPYQSSSKKSSLRDQRTLWMQREGLVYRALLFSTLSELGVVTLGSTSGHSADEAFFPDLFFITPFGARVLADLSADSIEAAMPSGNQKVLLVQPNYEVIVRQPTMLVLYHLLRFTQVAYLGPISTLKLTKSALLRGLESGLRVDQMLTFLQQYCQNEFPQNVSYTIEQDWSRGYKEAMLTEVILVELMGEQAEGDFLRAVSSLGCVARKLLPGIFVVVRTGDSFFDLRKSLEKAEIVVRGKPAKKPSRW